MRLIKTFILSSILAAMAMPAFAQVSRPEPEKGPTEVEVSIFVIDVDDVNTAAQNFEANVFYRCLWNDPRLAHEGPGEKIYPLSEVWHPNMQFVNQQKIWSTFPEEVEVQPDGTVTYRQRVWGMFSQPLKLRDFPFDEQEFRIQMIASGNTPEEVYFTQNPKRRSGIADNFSVADWEILGWEVDAGRFKPQVSAQSVAGVAMVFTGARGSGYFIVKVIMPLIFIVAMSWTVFWIDPAESGTQINVSITAILTLIAYSFTTSMTLPKLSYLTRLDYFIISATVLVYASLVEVVVTSWYAHNNRIELARTLDRWARWVFPIVFIILTVETLVVRFFV